MMMSKILLAIEDLDVLDAMEEFIAQLQWRASMRVKVVHVIEPNDAISYWPSLEYRTEAESLKKSVIDRLSDRFPELTIEGVVLEGIAKEAILEAAQEWGADAILVGTHGRHGLEKFFLGTVSTEVVTHAKCTVIVLRNVRSSVNQADVHCSSSRPV